MVGKTEYEGLSAEVRDFEPVTALVPNFVDSDKIPSHDHHHDHGGSHSHAPSTPPDKPEGLEHLIAVVQEAFVALKPGGLLLWSTAMRKAAAIKVLLESHKWENVLILKDLSGHDRVASARKPAGLRATVLWKRHACFFATIHFFRIVQRRYENKNFGPLLAIG